jgi:hypothetical protein
MSLSDPDALARRLTAALEQGANLDETARRRLFAAMAGLCPSP